MNALIQRRFIRGLIFLIGFIDASLLVGKSQMFAVNILANLALYASSLVQSNERLILLISLPSFIFGAVAVGLIEDEQFEGAQPFLSISLLLALAGITFSLLASGIYYQGALVITACAAGMLHAGLVRLQHGDQLVGLKEKSLKHIFVSMKNMLNPFHVLNSFSLTLFFILGCLAGAILTAKFGISSLLIAACLLSLMCIYLKVQIPAAFGENIIRFGRKPNKETSAQDEKY